MEKYNNFNIARFYSERKALDRRTVYNRFARKHNQEELAVARGGLEGFGDEFNMHFNPFAVSVLRLSFSFPQFLFFFCAAPTVLCTEENFIPFSVFHMHTPSE